MPWKERSAMSLRHEFILLAVQEGTGVRALCRRFGISRKTAYKWLTRYRGEGIAGLRERSRRPRRSPRQSTAAVELAVLGVRLAQPRWGGRKIRARLQAQGAEAVPAASTITAIVRRHGGIDPAWRCSTARGSASSTWLPMRCGRWTSRATFPCSAEAAAIR